VAEEVAIAAIDQVFAGMLERGMRILGLTGWTQRRNDKNLQVAKMQMQRPHLWLQVGTPCSKTGQMRDS
jgi:hypothetical protein